MTGPVIVVGATGRLGAAVVEAFADRPVLALTRGQLDITDPEAVGRRIAGAAPGVVINCAAFNDVDGAEDRCDAALDVNAFAVRSLARAAAEAGAALVHYGTDFVFDGRAASPYRETDRPNPQSVYASSKLLGEWFAADVPRHYVLRVESLFGGPEARSSIDRILEALLAGRPARVFVDRVVSPTYVEDCAMATEALLARDAPPGLYHCVNAGHTSWYELAREVARQAGVEPRLEPVSVASVTLKARRPTYCALAIDKLRSVGIEMPTWQDAIRRHLEARRA